MKTLLNIQINDRAFEVEPGMSVAAALAKCGHAATRVSTTGKPRAPLCGMGICQECRVKIDGRLHQLACQTICTEGMSISTGVKA